MSLPRRGRAGSISAYNEMTIPFSALSAVQIKVPVLAFVLGIVVGGLLIEGLHAIAVRMRVPPTEQSTLECIAQYFGKNALTMDNAVLANAADSFCYSSARHQYLLNDFAVRRDAYAIQPFETKVIMWMVVALVACGIYMAWLQLAASYELALLGRNLSSENTESNVKIAGMSVRSSVIGVIILVISFAFFGIYVRYVYTIDDASSLLPQDAKPAATSSFQPAAVDEHNGIGPPPTQIETRRTHK